MAEVFSRQIKRPDAVIFLGDGLMDLLYCDFENIPLFAVRGNCDVYRFFVKGNAEDEIVMTLGGKKIMMVHGDRYAVKNGYGRIVAAANEKGADIVLFGHTHTPFEKYLPAGECEYGILLKKPLYLFNPGSVGDHGGSFGSVCIRDNGDVVLSHGEV
jgi:putative phosphoesterase